MEERLISDTFNIRTGGEYLLGDGRIAGIYINTSWSLNEVVMGSSVQLLNYLVVLTLKA